MKSLTIGAVVSQEIQDNDRALRNDSFILAMAAELAPMLPLQRVSMGAALREYERRGGANAITIGGPARAIAALLGIEEIVT